MANEWDAAAPEYADSWEKTTGYTVGRLVDWLAPRPEDTIADVACGPGTVTVALLERGARVRATDFSPAMIEQLRARVAALGQESRVEAEVADAATLPLADDSVAAAVSNFGVIFCPDIAAALHELVRVTRSGGRLAMTAWTTEDINGWTMLLGADHEAVLGFTLPPRTACRWKRETDFRDSLVAAGWNELAVETVDFPPTIHASPDDVRHAIETPATRIALQSLTDAQRNALADYLAARARELYGEAEVPLSRQAWLARGIA